jgi:hypothetical protein
MFCARWLDGLGVQVQRGWRNLFMSQSHHGIDLHGAPGRDEAR